jgi:hypothetical protein
MTLNEYSMGNPQDEQRCFIQQTIRKSADMIKFVWN